jgi:hypothetical protein
MGVLYHTPPAWFTTAEVRRAAAQLSREAEPTGTQFAPVKAVAADTGMHDALTEAEGERVPEALPLLLPVPLELADDEAVALELADSEADGDDVSDDVALPLELAVSDADGEEEAVRLPEPVDVSDDVADTLALGEADDDADAEAVRVGVVEGVLLRLTEAVGDGVGTLNTAFCTAWVSTWLDPVAAVKPKTAVLPFRMPACLMSPTNTE